MPKLLASLLTLCCAAQAGDLTIDYPTPDSIFPPDFSPPEFHWRDSSRNARLWVIDFDFGGSAPPIRISTAGPPFSFGEIDPRCSAPSNQPPAPTPAQAATHTWRPDDATWSTIQLRSKASPARLTITGFSDAAARRTVSRASVTFTTSADPVGAPIFYRDVPLMPSELQKGVIKPLAPSLVPLIAWRLRSVSEPHSHLLMEGLHTCANCHSFSADGKFLAMDMDGPQNDKGLYAISSVQPNTSIRNQDVISWKDFADQPSGPMRVGFMSQISPDGRYVVTTVGAEKSLERNYYVANFKDYRFLQVFYATRGILVVYDRSTGKRHSLPGADDPTLVQTNAVWSPSGDYLVFARAQGRDPYSPDTPLAEFANDPHEAQVQYDLYRLPFNQGRGGRAEPIPGASRNGMSNSFPKVSPDGRWIVFVQARNGLLMRPDSQLFIVPAAGGPARRMNCNTRLMNSWHSFSPNGRWIVFSSKARSPYTQMYLTHIDENGNDSPPILIDNATAANRAVNLPEFVNVPPAGLLRIDTPAVDFYRISDEAWALGESGKLLAAVDHWHKALELNPSDPRANNNLGVILARLGRLDEAIPFWRKAIAASDGYADVHRNLGAALLGRNQYAEAALQFQAALVIDPLGVETRYLLALTLLNSGNPAAAAAEYRTLLAAQPAHADAASDLGIALLRQGLVDDAISQFRRAIALASDRVAPHFGLGDAFYLRRLNAQALAEWRGGLTLEPANPTVLNQAAWLMAASPEQAVRNSPDALAFAARAVELSGGREPAYLDTLAVAYASAGRFPEAIDTARRALSLAVELNRAQLIQNLRKHIELFEAAKPFLETQ